MPTFQIELEDGRKFNVEANRQPTDDEAMGAIRQHLSTPAKTEPPREPESQFRSDLGVAGQPVPASGEERAARDLELQKQAGVAFQGKLPEVMRSPAAAVNTVMDLAGRAATGVANIPSRLANLTKPPTEQVPLLEPNVPKFTIPQIEPEQMAGEGKATQVAAGVYNKLAEMGTGLTTPGSAFTLATLPAGAARVAFGTQIAANIPGTVQESAKTLLSKDSSLMEKGGAIAAPIAEGWMLKTIVKSAPMLPRAAKAAADAIGKPTLEKGVQDAIRQRSAEAVPVGATPGGSPEVGQGVPAPEKAPEAQAPEAAAAPVKQPVRLSTEHQALLDEAIPEIGRPVRVVADDDLDPNNAPFAQSVRGKIATIDRASGQILINPKELGDWLTQDVPKGREKEAVRSLLSEENIHLATRDEWAKAYHDSLTPLERSIGQRVYGGKDGKPLDPVALGHEMLRQRIQQLARMPVRETIERSLKERWTVNSLLAVGDAVRGIRETLGTKASKEGLKYLDKVQGNLNAALSARGVLKTSNALVQEPDNITLPPAAIRKVYHGTPHEVEKFSTEKIGTGEGAQVYGWGLYFAENPKVAENYAVMKGADYTKPRELAAAALYDYQNDHSAAIDALKKGYNFSQTPESTAEAIRILESGESPKLGNTYAAELKADPDELLDWDKPLSNQSEAVKSALEKLGFDKESQRGWGYEGSELYQYLSSYRDQENIPHAVRRQSTSKEASEKLASVGIKGIKYSDAGSRFDAKPFSLEDGRFKVRQPDGADYPFVFQNEQAAQLTADRLNKEAKRTSNYVIFNDADIRITGKNGKEVSHPEALKEQGESPAATRKRREEGQRELPLPPIKEPVERPSATDLGATERVTPRTLKPEHIAFDEAGGAAFRPITDAESSNPALLEKFITKGGRTGGSKRNESITNKIVVLWDKVARRVDVVSAYDHSRNGAMLGDPTKFSKDKDHPHAQLETLLWRYKPLYSIQLKEPVQNFHERYANMGEFQQEFGNAASEEAAKRIGAVPEVSTTGKVSPETGKAPKFQAEQFSIPVDVPEVQAGSGDAAAIHDFFKGKTPASPDEMKAMLIRGIGSDSARRLASGFKRMVELEQVQNPEASAEEAIHNALDKIYDDLKQSGTNRDTFTKRFLGRFAEQAARTNEPGAEAGQTSPAAIRKILTPAQEQASKTYGQIRAFFNRQDVKRGISALVDSAQTQSASMSQEAKRNIQQPSSGKGRLYGQPEPLRAARAVNAVFSPSYKPRGSDPGAAYPSPSVKAIAHADPGELPNLLKMTQEGVSKAEMLLAAPNDATLAAVGLPELAGMSTTDIRKAGRLWKKSATELGKEVEYAIAHFDEPDLMQTAVNLREKLGEELAFEHANGKATNEVENYLPGLYEGEIYNDHSVTFANRVLGKAYGKPKTFANQYEAIAAGPYIPTMNSVADIAAHRIRAGHSAILRDQAFKSVLGMTDELTKTPLAIDAEPSPQGGYQVPGGNLQYELVHPNGGGKPLAVRSGYVKLMNDLFGRSGIESWIGGKGLLKVGAIEKHTTLAGDVFHLSRMLDYALATLGLKTGYKGGFAALEFAAKDMPEAVKRGVITKEQMDWAMEPKNVLLDGTAQTLTRKQLLTEHIKSGLNVGQIQDAMYKHFVDKLDVVIGGKRIGIGAFNRFLFDEWTRGFLANAAVEETLRMQKANPTMDAREIMKRRTIPDANSTFGSTGKQGWVKNPTLRDILQLGFLAPSWTGSRIATEAKFLSRLATYPYVRLRYGKAEANIHFGSIGRTVGRGILSMMVLTQAINLYTRHKLTFQNEEEDHKLDAWIPDFHGGPGHWVSPLSVFLETVHDVYRYMAGGRKDLGETLTQMGSNKLSPIGRSAMVLATGYTPMGQKIPDFTGRLKETAKALIPTPITISAAAREAGHAAAPNLVAPNPHGALQRQLISSMGIKSETEQGLQSQMIQKAKDFMKAKGLDKTTGWQQVQTTDPNYTKLRLAIRNGDTAAAGRILESLKVNRSVASIAKAMEHWRDAKYTNKKLEGAFIASLTPKEKELYTAARVERQQEYQAFIQFLLHH